MHFKGFGRAAIYATMTIPIQDPLTQQLFVFAGGTTSGQGLIAEVGKVATEKGYLPYNATLLMASCARAQVGFDGIQVVD